MRQAGPRYARRCYIKNDIVYLTDRDDHVVLKYTLDGKPSDTGRVLRAAGPFNKPTEMVLGRTATCTSLTATATRVSIASRPTDT